MKRGKADRIRRGGLVSRYVVENNRALRAPPLEIGKKVETVAGDGFGGQVRCPSGMRRRVFAWNRRLTPLGSPS
jgi:hypothetical protein